MIFQTIAVGIILSIALALTLRRLTGFFRTRSTGCTGCSGCSISQTRSR